MLHFRERPTRFTVRCSGHRSLMEVNNGWAGYDRVCGQSSSHAEVRKHGNAGGDGLLLRMIAQRPEIQNGGAMQETDGEHCANECPLLVDQAILVPWGHADYSVIAST